MGGAWRKKLLTSRMLNSLSGSRGTGPHRVIVLIDYENGILGTTENMFRRIGVRWVESLNSRLVADANRIILPETSSVDPCI